MKKNKFLNIVGYCLIIMLFVGCHSKTTTPTSALPVLTQAQMYQDFDYLVYIIENVNPQLCIKKKITDSDILAELKLMRNEVKDCKNTEDFVFLINKTLTLMQDGHCYFLAAGPSLMPYKIAQNLYGLTDSIAYNNTVKYLNLIETKEKKRKFWLSIKYYNGEYYLARTFNYNNKVYEAVGKLIECDGENIHSFVQKLTKYRFHLQWDKQNKRYYSTNFYCAFIFMNKNSFTLSVITKDNKKLTDTFNIEQSANGESQYQYSFGKVKVKYSKYIEKDKILYIRLKKMAFENIKLDEINEVANNKKINKVIIDIRRNTGGNDKVWENLLARLIDKPLIYNTKILVKNTDIIKQKYYKERINTNKTEKCKLLDNEDFIILWNGNDTIKPDSKSIKFKGKIYLLQDEEIYSSSLALSCVAARSNKIVSIGKTTGWIGGRGITPLAFTLPNTKLIFTIAPSIDATNIKNINDFWKDTVEVPVNIPLEYYIKNINQDKADLENDPYYQKVLEQK